MRLACVEFEGAVRTVVAHGDELIDLTSHLGVQPSGAAAFAGLGEEALRLAAGAVRDARSRLRPEQVRFRPPVAGDKILGVGMNYGAFVAAARAAGMSVPPDPIWFYRPRSCLAGAADDILLPHGSDDFDFECELAVVIGRSCRNVTAAEAPGVIAGYSVANDLTLRRQVARSLVFAKSFDTHTPVGPWIVTADEVGDPHRLGVRTWVNGRQRQSGDTSDMLASCFELVAEVSGVCTLNPGDIILTGTPDGCGVFDGAMLAVGDVVRCEIDGLGSIENCVVDEAASAVGARDRAGKAAQPAL